MKTAKWIQRETKFERAISWARLNAASVITGSFFATMIFMFLVSPRHPRPLRYERGLDTQPLLSSYNLWLPSVVFVCALSRKFNVHLAKIICLNHKLLIKIVFEQNWLRTCFAKIVYEQLGLLPFFGPRYLCEYFGIRIPWDCWDHMYGRNLWGEWDQHYLTNIFLIYLFCIFNINICFMYVNFSLFTMWYKGKGDQGGRAVTPSSTCKSRSRQRARDRSHHDASLRPSSPCILDRAPHCPSLTDGPTAASSDGPHGGFARL